MLHTCVLCITLYCNYYEEMNLAMKASNQKVKSSTTLKYVFDIKNWIAPHLDEIHGHTAPHVFRFRLTHAKRAEMHYQNWSHDPWKPITVDGIGLILLKVYIIICMLYNILSLVCAIIDASG